MRSSPLEALQRRFVRSITFVDDPALAAGVSGGGKLSAAEALAVYRAGYPARLTEALGETFETCWRVLGDEQFFAVAKDYIARTPSLSHNLSDYGATFPDFLESPAFGRFGISAPYLGDLARFEWSFKELFHEAPRAGLEPQGLAAAARPDSVLTLGPRRLLALRHRVYGLWKRDRADDTPVADREWTGPERVLLYKKGGNDVFVRVLSAAEHSALAALSAGRPLEAALAAAEGLDAAGAQELFAFLAGERLVAEVR